MIQEIAPHSLDTAFAHPQPKESDYVLLFDRSDVLVMPQTGALPTCRDWHKIGGEDILLQHLFQVDGVQFFTVLDLPEGMERQLKRETSRYLRQVQPNWLKFASVTGLHLYQWYQTHRFCGICGAPMQPDGKELAMRCTCCNAVTYPTICPAIIVGITDGDRILLTKSSVYEKPVYALISGYMEVGETMEEAVAREAMEETGLKIKNIRYYDNQPWGFSGTQMIGFWAELDGSDKVTIQRSELKEATWFTPEEMPVTEAPLDLTHHMMELFRQRKLPGMEKKWLH